MNRLFALAPIVSLLSLAVVACDKDKKPDPSAASSASPSVAASQVAPASSSGPTAASAASAASAAPAEEPFEARVAKSTPLAITTADQTVPGGTVKAQACTIEGGPPLHKSGMDLFKSIRVVGDRVFVLYGSDKTVHVFKSQPGAACKLTVDKSFSDDGVIKVDSASLLATDAAGNLWVSTGVFGAKRFGKDGKENGKCDARPLGLLYTNPKGDLGIGTFANTTVAKVSLTPDGACKSEPWSFQDLGQAEKRKGPFSNAQAVGFVGDTIYMGAIVAKEIDPETPTVVVALDATGKEKHRLGAGKKAFTDGRFGWVHAIAPCKAGVCVLDSNARRLSLWKTATPDFVASVDLSKLFGLKYPWLADFDMEGANAWFIAGQDREGAKNVAEGTIFRVTGL